MPPSLPPMPVTVATTAFEAALASRSIPRYLQPLGHDRAEEPAGVVGGLVAPVGHPVALQGGPERSLAARPLRTVLRSRAFGASPTVARLASGPAPAPPAPPASVPRLAVVTDGDAAGDDVPVGETEGAAEEWAGPEPADDATNETPGADVAEGGPMPSAAEAHSRVAPAAEVEPAGELPTVSRAVAPEPAARDPAPVGEDRPTAASVDALVAGRPRRLGLGAPLPSRPVGAQRWAEDEAGRLPRATSTTHADVPRGPSIQRAPADVRPTAPVGPVPPRVAGAAHEVPPAVRAGTTAPAVDAAPPARAGLPAGGERRPVAPGAPDVPVPGERSPAGAGSAAGVAQRPTGEGSEAGGVAPLLGSKPSSQQATTSGDVSHDVAPVHPATGPHLPVAARADFAFAEPVTIQRTARASPQHPAPRGSGGRAGEPGATDAPGEAVRADRPLSVPAAPLLGAEPLAPVIESTGGNPAAGVTTASRAGRAGGPARPVGSAAPEPFTAQRSALPTAALGAPVRSPADTPFVSGRPSPPVGAPAVQRTITTAPTPLVGEPSRPATAPVAAAVAYDVPSPAAAALAAGVARLEPDGSVVFAQPVGEATAIQREPAEVGTDAAAAPAGGAASGAPAPTVGSAVGAAPGGGSMTSEQLEMLAKQLYDRIRERFRSELRLDRERWGRLTDLVR